MEIRLSIRMADLADHHGHSICSCRIRLYPHVLRAFRFKPSTVVAMLGGHRVRLRLCNGGVPGKDATQNNCLGPFSHTLYTEHRRAGDTRVSTRRAVRAYHLQRIATEGDTASTNTNNSGLEFYAAPKMRLFLTLLSLSLELAGGLALHEVRTALKLRRTQPSPEGRRLQIVEQELGQNDARLIFLRNEPEVFEAEFRRNHTMGLLHSAAQHAGKTHPNWPATLTFLTILCVGSATLRGQSIDVLEALDYSATSKATGYDGNAAYLQNIQAAARIIASLPAGSRITVAGISDQSFARPLVLLTGEFQLSGPIERV